MGLDEQSVQKIIKGYNYSSKWSVESPKTAIDAPKKYKIKRNICSGF